MLSALPLCRSSPEGARVERVERGDQALRLVLSTTRLLGACAGCHRRPELRLCAASVDGSPVSECARRDPLTVIESAEQAEAVAFPRVAKLTVHTIALLGGITPFVTRLR